MACCCAASFMMPMLLLPKQPVITIQGTPGEVVSLLSLLIGSLYSFVCSFLEPVSLLKGKSCICCSLLIIGDVLHAMKAVRTLPHVDPNQTCSRKRCAGKASAALRQLNAWQQHLIVAFLTVV